MQGWMLIEMFCLFFEVLKVSLFVSLQLKMSRQGALNPHISIPAARITRSPILFSSLSHFILSNTPWECEQPSIRAALPHPPSLPLCFLTSNWHQVKQKTCRPMYDFIYLLQSNSDYPGLSLWKAVIACEQCLPLAQLVMYDNLS